MVELRLALPERCTTPTLQYRQRGEWPSKWSDWADVPTEVIRTPKAPQHVCGMQGFDGMLDECPACEANRRAAPGVTPCVPAGWKIERHNDLMQAIVITAPNGYSALVSKIDRNPSNVLYMLAEALIGTAGVPEAPALKRPARFEFAMDFLGDPEATELRQYIEALEAALGVALGDKDGVPEVPK